MSKRSPVTHRIIAGDKHRPTPSSPVVRKNAVCAKGALTTPVAQMEHRQGRRAAS